MDTSRVESNNHDDDLHNYKAAPHRGQRATLVRGPRDGPRVQSLGCRKNEQSLNNSPEYLFPFLSHFARLLFIYVSFSTYIQRSFFFSLEL